LRFASAAVTPETDERDPGEPPLEAQEAPIAAEEIPGSPGHQREHPIAQDAEAYEGEAEKEDLPVHAATRSAAARQG
jgi:hypothetical protein